MPSISLTTNRNQFIFLFTSVGVPFLIIFFSHLLVLVALFPLNTPPYHFSLAPSKSHKLSLLSKVICDSLSIMAAFTFTILLVLQ